MCCWTGPYMGGRSRGRTRPPAGHKGGNSLANKHTAPTDVPPPNGPGWRPDAPTTWAPPGAEPIPAWPGAGAVAREQPNIVPSREHGARSEPFTVAAPAVA